MLGKFKAVFNEGIGIFGSFAVSAYSFVEGAGEVVGMASALAGAFLTYTLGMKNLADATYRKAEAEKLLKEDGDESDQENEL